MKRIGRVRGALERSGPWRLLVVDDDEELVRIVRRAASVFATDLAVDVALTAEEARALLARERYDVVLLDQVLDGTNRGVDLLGAMPRRQPGAVVAMMSSPVPGSNCQAIAPLLTLAYWWAAPLLRWLSALAVQAYWWAWVLGPGEWSPHNLPLHPHLRPQHRWAVCPFHNLTGSVHRSAR